MNYLRLFITSPGNGLLENNAIFQYAEIIYLIQVSTDDFQERF